MSDEWEWREGDRESVVVNWEAPGQTITGELKDVRTGKFGNNVYDVLTEHGDLVTVFGCTVLDDRLKKEDLGKVVYIEFLGKRKSGSGNEYKDFKVGVRLKAVGEDSV